MTSATLYRSAAGIPAIPFLLLGISILLAAGVFALAEAHANLFGFILGQKPLLHATIFPLLLVMIVALGGGTDRLQRWSAALLHPLLRRANGDRIDPLPPLPAWIFLFLLLRTAVLVAALLLALLASGSFLFGAAQAKTFMDASLSTMAAYGLLTAWGLALVHLVERIAAGLFTRAPR
ncbi:MAG: hypothetical protein ACFBQW_01430 [Sphingomonadaceae bacterium]